MEYLKQALTFEQQADQLIERGLQADRDQLIKRLSAVSYYRLSGYLYPFRRPGSEGFSDDACLDTVWKRYCFDRRLRVLFLDAIERVEVAVRTQLVQHFACAFGPFGHCEEKNLPNLSIAEYIEWRQGLLSETSRSKELFKKHFFTKYGDVHKNLPLWMGCELMSMGSLLTFFKGVDGEIAGKVSVQFGLADQLLLSWLRSLYAVRNVCAHHARLWNRVLGYAPSLPQKNKYPEWHIKDTGGKNLLPNDRVRILLMICRAFLRTISPTSLWSRRVEQLFDEYPEIPVRAMSLPQDWKSHPLWREDATA